MSEQELQNMIRRFMESLINAFKFPVGRDLVKVFFITLGIFVASLLSSVFGVMHVVSWQGALLAVTYIGALILIERGGKREIHRMYQSAKLHIENFKSGQARPSEEEHDVKCDDDTTSGEEKSVGEGHDSTVEQTE